MLSAPRSFSSSAYAPSSLCIRAPQYAPPFWIRTYPSAASFVLAELNVQQTPYSRKLSALQCALRKMSPLDSGQWRARRDNRNGRHWSAAEETGEAVCGVFLELGRGRAHCTTTVRAGVRGMAKRRSDGTFRAGDEEVFAQRGGGRRRCPAVRTFGALITECSVSLLTRVKSNKNAHCSRLIETAITEVQGGCIQRCLIPPLISSILS